MNEKQRAVAIDFIHAHRLAVVATTAADQAPECALVAYAAKGTELVIVTDEGSRKYENLVRRPRVALVIGCDGPATLQVEGDARELGGEAAAEHAALVLHRYPETAAFLSRPTARIFVIGPRWMRFSDYSHAPPEIFEICFS